MNTGTTLTSPSYYHEALSTVTRKGQTTVPQTVRDALRIQEGDKIAFVVHHDKRVELVKRGSVVAQTAAILRTDKPHGSAEQLRTNVEQAIADETMRRAA